MTGLPDLRRRRPWRGGDTRLVTGISRGLATAFLAAGLTVGPGSTPFVPTPASAAAGAGVAVSALPPGGAAYERRVIGRSRAGRPIFAWRLGEPGGRPVVLLSTMHGDEPATRSVLTSLRDGRPVTGIDLWVVPVVNPDGLARDTRHNARGVDLNRNFPHAWTDLDGRYESGPRPSSEPETRAVMRFLSRVRPRRVISFHQPLHGVDTDTKDARFARRLARALRLPPTRLDCGGACHGTMTGWFNARFPGAALTVEYGVRPTRHRMRVQAPRQLLRVLGARRPGQGAGAPEAAE